MPQMAMGNSLQKPVQRLINKQSPVATLLNLESIGINSKHVAAYNMKKNLSLPLEMQGFHWSHWEIHGEDTVACVRHTGGLSLASQSHSVTVEIVPSELA